MVATDNEALWDDAGIAEQRSIERIGTESPDKSVVICYGLRIAIRVAGISCEAGGISATIPFKRLILRAVLRDVSTVANVAKRFPRSSGILQAD
jgi:hypothetical protein